MKRSLLTCDWCADERDCRDESEEFEALEDGWSLLSLFDPIREEVVTKAYCSTECRRADDS